MLTTSSEAPSGERGSLPVVKLIPCGSLSGVSAPEARSTLTSLLRRSSLLSTSSALPSREKRIADWSQGIGVSHFHSPEAGA